MDKKRKWIKTEKGLVIAGLDRSSFFPIPVFCKNIFWVKPKRPFILKPYSLYASTHNWPAYTMVIYVHIAFYGHSRAIFTINHDLSNKSKPHMVEQYKFVYILSNTITRASLASIRVYIFLWVFITLYGSLLDSMDFL